MQNFAETLNLEKRVLLPQAISQLCMKVCNN